MFNRLNLFPVLAMTTPSFVEMFRGTTSSSFDNVHQILIGASPLVIVQTADTASSRLTSSSPNVKGLIWGRTAIDKIFISISKLQNSENREGTKLQITVDGEISADLRDSAFVSSVARVIAAVSWLSRLDGQHRSLLARFCYHHAVVVAQVSFHIEVDIEERPPDFNRQIAFVHRAHCRHRFVNVDRFVSELKRNDQRKD